MPVDLVKGNHGQFDVTVDGQVVMTRKGGLVAKLVSRPWPTEEAILNAVQAAIQPAAK